MLIKNLPQSAASANLLEPARDAGHDKHLHAALYRTLAAMEREGVIEGQNMVLRLAH